ncbi:Beta-lactamase superfamily domain-containing protein [Collimonas sp. OK307]|nr:Beta-lactamase superfamily domain-containing protein [Collimonas sp. OK307]
MSHSYEERLIMKITQLRNATIVLEIGAHRILVDPMLAPKDALPPLKFLGQRQRNPVVELPVVADTMLESVTHCLITHCQKGHFDHLDHAGKEWLRTRQIPVICTPHDADYLRQRDLNVCPLPVRLQEPQAFLGGQVRTVPCSHGRGMIGLLMEHGVGYFIEMPGEPSLYLSGDTILTPAVRDFAARHQPNICVVPAGGARFDVGYEIIMGTSEVIEFTLALKGTVIANHLEALSHCPVRRSELSAAAAHAGVTDRLRIPEDGETLELTV